MSWQEIATILKNDSPLLSLLIDNPSEEIAAEARALIASTLGTTTDDDVIKVALNDPDNINKIRQYEISNFKNLLNVLNKDKLTKEESIRLAYDREMRLITIGHWAAFGTPIVSIIVTIGFFGILYLVITKYVIGKETPGDVVLILIGTLASAFTAVTNYYLGSSIGSKQKDLTIRKIGSEDKSKQTE